MGHRPAWSEGHPSGNAALRSQLSAAVEASTLQLHQAWASDPATVPLPFPQVKLLPSGVDANSACTPGAPARDPAPAGIYCATRNAVLLEHDLLANAYGFNKTPAVAYWIALSLAERLRTQGAKLSPPAANLHANCLAGVLLGGSTDFRSSPAADAVVRAAGRAYGDGDISTVATPEQRAYAVLSGYGATPSNCSEAEMAQLAKGLGPDPAKLGTLAQAVRANSSFQAAYRSQCQSLPNKPCPRPIASSLNPANGSRP